MKCKASWVVCTTVLCVLAWGCSKSSSPASEQAQTQPKEPAAQSAAPEGDDLPPVVRIPWKGDLEAIAKRRIVRVLLPFRRPEFFYIEGRPAGILFEAFQEIERELNKKYKTNAANRIVVALLPTPQDKVRERMQQQLGDIVAYGASITDENKAVVDFTVPTLSGQKVIVVTGPGAPELKSIEDLGGKEIWINPKSRHKNDIAALNVKLKAAGKAPAIPRELDPVIEPGDLMEMVNAGVFPIALASSNQAEFWSQVFDHAKPRMDLAVAEDVELAWAIQKGTPQLKAFLDDFIRTHGIGTSFGNTLVRRYFKDAKYVRNATEANELKKFRTTAPVFAKYSTKYDLDFLLMVAQGYQESRLDQTVKSPVGAVGIMQVMPSTAAGHPVKISNIQNEENNIHAGVRMMHFLVQEHFNEPGLDRMNRTLFAIAAYNAGPARITRCRASAKEMGLDPNKWWGNVEVAVAKAVGSETTTYVANIYKYYVAYQLARETNLRRMDAVKKAAAPGAAH